VIGYWNELYIAREEIHRYGFKKGDVLKLAMKNNENLSKLKSRYWE
jgi:hypothetical protein